MLQAFQTIAVFCAALFAGAALYINLVEHPARMTLETRVAAAQWAPSYKRATWMQAPLALLSCVAGVVAWLMGASAGWLVAGLLIGSVVPVTFVVIMPTNRKLLAKECDRHAPATRSLLEHWGTLHSFRTALGLAASTVFLVLLLTHPG